MLERCSCFGCLMAMRGETEIYINLLDNSSPSIDKIKANTLYWNLVAKLDCTIPAIQKWETELPEFFNQKRRSDATWREIFIPPYKMQKEVRYQSLQYRLLTRIIPCNNYLHRVRILETDLLWFMQKFWGKR